MIKSLNGCQLLLKPIQLKLILITCFVLINTFCQSQTTDTLEIIKAPSLKKKYWVGIAGSATILTAGWAWYRIDEAFNAPDFVYKETDQKWFNDRFLSTEAYRYDNNSSLVNIIGHPIAGAGYYFSGRTGNLTVAESILLSTISSSIWEYGIEYKEFVSINDQYFTIFGGIALGEFIHQVLRSKSKKHPNEFLHDNEIKLRATQHTFSSSNTSYQDYYFGISNTNHIYHPYLYKRNRSTYFKKPFSSVFDWYFEPASYNQPIDSTIQSYQVGDYKAQYALGIDSYAYLMGYKHSFAHRDDLFNSAIVFAPFVGWELDEFNSNFVMDQLGIAHILGLASEYQYAINDLTINAKGMLSLDFGSIHPISQRVFPDSITHPGIRGAFKQKAFPYYFGWGSSGRLELGVNWRTWSLNGEIRYYQYDSKGTEGKDVEQEVIKHELTFTDSKDTWSLRIRKSFGEKWSITGEYLSKIRKSKTTLNGIPDMEYNFGHQMLSLNVGYSIGNHFKK